jgi:hypothetical protein
LANIIYGYVAVKREFNRRDAFLKEFQHTLNDAKAQIIMDYKLGQAVEAIEALVKIERERTVDLVRVM